MTKWCVVPQEVTEEMHHSGMTRIANTGASLCYAAMLAARPKLPPDIQQAVELAEKYKNEMVSETTMSQTESIRCVLSRALLKCNGIEP